MPIFRLLFMKADYHSTRYKIIRPLMELPRTSKTPKVILDIDSIFSTNYMTKKSGLFNLLLKNI